MSLLSVCFVSCAACQRPKGQNVFAQTPAIMQQWTMKLEKELHASKEQGWKKGEALLLTPSRWPNWSPQLLGQAKEPHFRHWFRQNELTPFNSRFTFTLPMKWRKSSKILEIFPNLPSTIPVGPGFDRLAFQSRLSKLSATTALIKHGPGATCGPLNFLILPA